MSGINALRAKKAGSAAKDLMVLPAESYTEKAMDNGKTYEFFQLGNQVLTVKALDKGVKNNHITVDYSPLKKDANGKVVKPEVVLDEVHVKILPGSEMFITDSGFIGFGKPGVMISAADLLA